jgi:hypothetical protein
MVTMRSSDTDIKCRLVEKLLRNRNFGDNKVSVDTLVNYSVKDSEAGRAKQLLRDEMIPQNEAGIVQIGGGARENVHLSDADKAVNFLKDNGGNVPFGF